jgi:hypothetical protein
VVELSDDLHRYAFVRIARMGDEGLDRGHRVGVETRCLHEVDAAGGRFRRMDPVYASGVDVEPRRFDANVWGAVAIRSAVLEHPLKGEGIALEACQPHQVIAELVDVLLRARAERAEQFERREPALAVLL